MNTHVKNERDGVLSILLFVHEEGGFLDEGIERVLSAGKVCSDGPQAWTDHEKRLIRRLAKGTIERQFWLDAQIDLVSDPPVFKMKPAVRDILRMSVYSLYFMEQIPARAVVNEAVELAKLRAPKELSGFVNGVLRQIVRKMESEESADAAKLTDTSLQGKTVGSKQWIKGAETLYCVPKWIIRLWLDDYGAEKTIQILEGVRPGMKRRLTVRPNRTKITEPGLMNLWIDHGIDCGSAGESGGVWFKSDRPVSELPGYQEGLFYIQDFGSILAGDLAPAKSEDQVLDLCAAPGGKATQLAERAGHVLACDLHESKLPLMRENAERLGLTNMDFMAADATDFNPAWKGEWDVVLADVPCSGLGVIGHKPDIKLRLKKEDIGELVELQRAILENAVRYVKPGGYLVYSTCTVCRDENDRQIENLLEEHPQWQLMEMKQLFPSSNSDGFFMALLHKE